MTTPPRPTPARPSTRRTRRAAARLAAVQALYQIDLAPADPDIVIAEFKGHRLREDDGTDVDTDFFTEIVAGTQARREEIDGLLASLLAEGWTMARLESVLRAILRAAAFELLARGDVPARVVIDEYVNIAHAFSAGKETAFINGVLDRLGRRTRPEEFEGQPRAPENAPGR